MPCPAGTIDSSALCTRAKIFSSAFYGGTHNIFYDETLVTAHKKSGSWGESVPVSVNTLMLTHGDPAGLDGNNGPLNGER